MKVDIVRWVCLFLCLLVPSGKSNGQEPISDNAQFSVRIYSGNNGFAVVHITSKHCKNTLKYGYIGISTSGKPSHDRWATRLLADRDSNGSKELNFVMTIPAGATKGSDKFYLQTDRPLLAGPMNLLPLEVKHEQQGTLIFRSNETAQDSGHMKELRIDMKTNRATLSWHPEADFNVCWDHDGFTLISQSNQIEKWYFNMAPRIGFRGYSSGIATIFRKEKNSLPFGTGSGALSLQSCP